MANDIDPLGWLDEKKTISVNVDYDDPTPTPDLTVTPGDDLESAAQTVATQIATKMYGVDVRAALAQWLLLSAYLQVSGVDTLRQMKLLVNNYQASIEARAKAVEQRMTTTEADAKATAKEMTDAVAAGGEPFAAEVVAARSSSVYGDFPTLDDRLEKLEALIKGQIPGGATAIIPVNLGRQVPIKVTSYEYAIGTEPDGLGTGPYGLGGSTPEEVTSVVQWSDANTAALTLPADYTDVTENGTLKLMADGSWTVTTGYKTLRFVLS